jgi:hypothetical protein
MEMGCHLPMPAEVQAQAIVGSTGMYSYAWAMDIYWEFVSGAKGSTVYRDAAGKQHFHNSAAWFQHPIPAPPAQGGQPICIQVSLIYPHAFVWGNKHASMQVLYACT